LIATHRLRILVRPYCVQKLDAGADQILLTFGPDFAERSPIAPSRIIQLIQQNRNYKLAGQDKLALIRHCPTLHDKLAAVKDIFKTLSR
jgi:transcription-repair coupling factor (superfamily II helicase)